MTTENLQAIERAVSQLSPDELAEFRVLFAEFDAIAWDRQFEEDVATGKLDALGEKALKYLSKKRAN